MTRIGALSLCKYAQPSIIRCPSFASRALAPKWTKETLHITSGDAATAVRRRLSEANYRVATDDARLMSCRPVRGFELSKAAQAKFPAIKISDW
eukprot:scaffold599265_cov51-Prasinocladus_malaysianus.AAC.3